MAQMKAECTAYTNGRKTTQYRLGEDQAEAELTTRSGTTVSTKLFADGSGICTVTRDGEQVFRQVWPANDVAVPA